MARGQRGDTQDDDNPFFNGGGEREPLLRDDASMTETIPRGRSPLPMGGPPLRFVGPPVPTHQGRQMVPARSFSIQGDTRYEDHYGASQYQVMPYQQQMVPSSRGGFGGPLVSVAPHSIQQPASGSNFFQLGADYRLSGDNVVTDENNYFTPFSDWFIYLMALQFYYVTEHELQKEFKTTESYGNIKAIFGCLLKHLADCRIHMTDPSFKNRESVIKVTNVGQLLRKFRLEYLAQDEKARIKKIPEIERLADRCFASIHALLRSLFGKRQGTYADVFEKAFMRAAPKKKHGDSYAAEDALPLFRSDVGTYVMDQVAHGLSASQGMLTLPIFGPEWEKLFTKLFDRNAVNTRRIDESSLNQYVPGEVFRYKMTVSFGQTDLSNLNRAITGMVRALLKTTLSPHASGGLKQLCMVQLIPGILNGFLAKTRIYVRTNSQASDIRGQFVDTANNFFHARPPTGIFSCCEADPVDERKQLIDTNGSYYLFRDNAFSKVGGDVEVIRSTVRYGKRNS